MFQNSISTKSDLMNDPVERNKCENCEELVTFIEHEGSYTCPSCGACQSEKFIDLGNQWRDFETETGQTQKAFAERVLCCVVCLFLVFFFRFLFFPDHKLFCIILIIIMFVINPSSLF
jgi:hypothetical protein